MPTQTPAAPGPAPRRLLIVTQHFWPEAFRINDIVEGFLQRNIQVDVLCGLPNYPLGEWFSGYRYTGPRRENYKGAEVFRCGEIRRKHNTSLRIFLNYCFYPLAAIFSLPRLRGRRYNAVLCYETSPVMMILPAILYAKTHRVPLTSYVLDLWPDNLYSVLPVQNKALRRVAQAVSAWHYRHSTRLAALSDAQAKTLAQMARKKNGSVPPIAVVPQYAEDFYAEDIPDAKVEALFKDCFSILFAGNLSPAQDLGNLVRAVKQIRQTPQGKSVRVFILGDGMSKTELQQQIHAEGLEDAFTFLGSVPPQKVPCYTRCASALFAGLSASENLGLTVPAKIASYLAAGRPLLVAMDGEGARAATESGAALVSPAGNSAQLADNILKLAALPPAKRQAMGDAGRKSYRAHYSREKQLARLENFLFSGNAD